MALLLAACSDDSDDESAPAATEAGGDAGGNGTDAEPADDAGSSSGGEGAPATGGNLSCELVTSADLEAAGLTVEDGPFVEEGPFDQCIHNVLGSSGIAGTFSTRVLTEDQHGSLAPEAYNDWEDIPGIANEAWYIEGLNLAEARFRNGLQISVQDVPGDLGRDELVALLSLAVSRI